MPAAAKRAVLMVSGLSAHAEAARAIRAAAREPRPRRDRLTCGGRYWLRVILPDAPGNVEIGRAALLAFEPVGSRVLNSAKGKQRHEES